MSGEYFIELRNFTTGSRIAILTGATGSGDARNGFRRLTCAGNVNAPGQLVLDIPHNHPALPVLDKTQTILWRRDAARGIGWEREFVGLVRDGAYSSRGGERGVTLTCVGLLGILDWYHVLWPAGTANRTSWTGVAAETAMKNLVTYNCTASATTAAGRDRTAPLYGVSVAADTAGGDVIDWTANRAKTVLQELQAIAEIAGGDFDLVYTGPTSREFRFYAGQRGTDRTATVIFAERLGNMDNVRWSRQRSQERTAAVIGGQGEGAAREVVVRTSGPNYAADNDMETFVDARDIALGQTAQLEARGDAALQEQQARDVFTFDVLQTESTYYGGTYTLGDLVSAVRPDGLTVPVQVYGRTISYAPGQGEQIGVEIRTP